MTLKHRGAKTRTSVSGRASGGRRPGLRQRRLALTCSCRGFPSRATGPGHTAGSPPCCSASPCSAPWARTASDAPPGCEGTSGWRSFSCTSAASDIWSMSVGSETAEDVSGASGGDEPQSPAQPATQSQQRLLPSCKLHSFSCSRDA